MKYAPAILLARFLRWGIRRVRTGGGSALPGLLLSKLAPGILRQVLGRFEQGLVVITGSAGKSTTTKMAVAILRGHGLEVFTNPSTANILQGFYSTIASEATLSGRVKGQIAVLEMDEGHAAELVKLVRPRQSVILNVVEDQLDRFVDPSFVVEKLQTVVAATLERVHLNADDQNLLGMATSDAVPISWFGLAEQVREQVGELGYAPTYETAQVRPKAVTEIQTLEQTSVQTSSQIGSIGFSLPSKGPHFALDAAAAISLCVELLDSPDPAIFADTLDSIPPVFARGEIIDIAGQSVRLVLVQNPASMQLNLDTLGSAADCVYFGIGRDVHDASWLWTVRMPAWTAVAITAGFNANEAALFLEYQGISAGEVIADDIPASVERFLALPAPVNGIKTMVISADVMRRVRRYLGYDSPDAVRA